MSDPRMPNPPRIARWLLQKLTPDSYREFVVDDADDEFDRRRRQGRFARLWYWRQVLHVDLWRLRREGRARPNHATGRGLRMADLLRVELRQALRVFRRNPGFVLTVVLTLAVGIGGTTTIFSLINGLLLRPIPGVADTHAVVALEASAGGGSFGVSSY
ncbi:MAG: hypothetical protein ACR2QM_02355, partial [Longimicrobiales bacterium]